MSRGLTISAAVHAAVFALVLLVSRAPAGPAPRPAPLDQAPPRLVWLSAPGPGGGGGGGGNRLPDPPRTAERPGHDALTVPVAPPLRSTAAPSEREPDPAELTVPAK